MSVFIDLHRDDAAALLEGLAAPGTDNPITGDGISSLNPSGNDGRDATGDPVPQQRPVIRAEQEVRGSFRHGEPPHAP